jgi:thioredoxin-like negative regulator of GroEL
VSKEAAKKSRSLNVQALALHRAKKHTEAAALFVEALQANPGNILARYNLTCTYNLGGMRSEALTTLWQLNREDCRACAAQVLDAPNDEDWASALGRVRLETRSSPR